MCFGIFRRYWVQEMSRWGRTSKKYQLTNTPRRASSYITSITALEANPTRGQTPTELSTIHLPLRPDSTNRRSLSLTNLSLQPISSPPPLPPRRFRPPPPPPQPPRQLLRSNADVCHLQFPPSALISVLERNSVARNSRLVLDNPFVYFRFDSGASENLRTIPGWFEDEPPSYEEAVKMTPLEETVESTVCPTPNAEPSTMIQVEPTAAEADVDKAKNTAVSFRRETSV